MNCSIKSCNQEAEYHMKKGGIVCYDHMVKIVGYNPSNLVTCKHCGLIVPQIPHHDVPKKRLKEVNTKITSSAYWSFLHQHNTENIDGQVKENVFANPDIFTEDDRPYHRPLSERGELQFQVIQEALKDLSPQQQRVLYLCGQLGKSQEEAAKELGVQPPAVCRMLQRIQEIIKKRYQETEDKYGK